MKRSLRVPAALAFTVLTGTAAIAGIAAALPACGHGESPTDGQMSDGTPIPEDGGCAIFCIPDPESDAGMCPENPPCGDENGNCPAGCRPVG
jgi:hypothetical protein